ncbi:hypothetical protein D3C87_1272170 [compost metagenome]
MIPVDPPKKAMGINTAVRTSAMPMMAPVISPIDFSVASTGDRPSSDMMRSTFSTTTMASSTRRPIARTIANMVSVLIEYPVTARMPNVPRSTTGTAIIGMKVARRFCRKTSSTTKTRMIASISVCTTFSIDSFTKGVVS